MRDDCRSFSMQGGISRHLFDSRWALGVQAIRSHATPGELVTGSARGSILRFKPFSIPARGIYPCGMELSVERKAVPCRARDDIRHEYETATMSKTIDISIFSMQKGTT